MARPNPNNVVTSVHQECSRMGTLYSANAFTIVEGAGRMNSLMWNNLQTSSHRMSIPIATSQGMSLISSRREINVLVQAESFRARRQEAAKTGDEQVYLRKKMRRP